MHFLALKNLALMISNLAATINVKMKANKEKVMKLSMLSPRGGTTG